MNLTKEQQLVSICEEIGGIAERNNSYTLLITNSIKKPIEEMTIAELLEIHRSCLELFNRETA